MIFCDLYVIFCHFAQLSNLVRYSLIFYQFLYSSSVFPRISPQPLPHFSLIQLIRQLQIRIRDGKCASSALFITGSGTRSRSKNTFCKLLDLRGFIPLADVEAYGDRLPPSVAGTYLVKHPGCVQVNFFLPQDDD